MLFGLFGKKVDAAVKAEIESKIERFDGLALFDYAGMTVAGDSNLRKAARDCKLEVGVYKRPEVEAAIEGGKFYGILDGVDKSVGLLFFNTEDEMVGFCKALKRSMTPNPIYKIMLKGWPLPLDEVLAKIPEETRKVDFVPGNYYVEFLGSEYKVRAIKYLREQTGLDLYTSKEIVDGRQNCKMYFATLQQREDFERAFYDSGSMITFTYVDGGSANTQTTQTQMVDDSDGILNFQIIQMKSPIEAIKVYRELTGAGLKESKDAIDSGYIEISSGRKLAQEIVDAFGRVGCYIERRR